MKSFIYILPILLLNFTALHAMNDTQNQPCNPHERTILCKSCKQETGTIRCEACNQKSCPACTEKPVRIELLKGQTTINHPCKSCSIEIKALKTQEDKVDWVKERYSEPKN